MNQNDAVLDPVLILPSYDHHMTEKNKKEQKLRVGEVLLPRYLVSTGLNVRVLECTVGWVATRQTSSTVCVLGHMIGTFTI